MNINKPLKTELIAIFIAISSLSVASFSFAETIEIKQCNDLEAMWNSNRASVYELANDIDCSTIENFQPIGTTEDPFTAIFNGRGHTISNLQINRPFENNIGLFGVVAGAGLLEGEGLITNIHLKDSLIIGKNSVGGLIGKMQASSAIENAHVSNTRVSGAQQVGGLVGTLFNDSAIRYSDVTAELILGPVAAVQGADDIGGLVGRMESNGAIENSYARTSVAGKQYVGGLVGQLSSQGRISHSYATGSVEGTLEPLNYIPEEVIQEMIAEAFDEEEFWGAHSIGGLLGGAMNLSAIPSELTYNYASGNVSASRDTWDRVGGLAGEMNGNNYLAYSYYAEGKITIESPESTFLVGGLVGEAAGDDIINSYWDVDASGLDTLRGTPSDDDAIYGKTTAEMQDPATYQGWDFDQSWVFSHRDCEEYPYPALQRSATTGVCIGTLNEIEELRNNLDGVFRLVDDINLSSINNFEPIGAFEAPFTGLFNGNSHTISGLQIRAPADETAGIGFFAYAEDAVIRRLYLDEPVIWGNEASVTLGALVGDMKNSLVEEVVIVDPKITGVGFIGALAGNAIDSTIQKVHTHISGQNTNNAFIVGQLTTGGLVGFAKNTIISDVYNEVPIITVAIDPIYVGGIVGSMQDGANLSAAYNVGTIEYSYSSGSGIPLRVGGLAGVTYEPNMIAYSYWSTEPNQSVGGGSYPANHSERGSTEKLKTQDFFKNNGAVRDGVGFFFVGTKTGENIPAWVMPENDYPKLIFSKYR